jgi:hypothetical protein
MDATADSATCEANRKHVVEESVQALFAPRVPVQKTLATARPAASELHAITSAGCRQSGSDRAVTNPAKARRRHVDFSGVSQSRKATSEKSTEK